MKVNIFIVKIRCMVVLLSVLLLYGVSAHAQSGVKYPYVDNTSDTKKGPIIVMQDDKGGVSDAIIGVHDGVDFTYNKVGAKFQVEKTNRPTNKNWSDAIAECASNGWRLPTQREMILIWVLGGAEQQLYNVQVGNPKEHSGTSDHLAGGSPLYSYPGFTAFGTYDTFWTITEESTNTNKAWRMHGSRAESDSYWSPKTDPLLVRCVRDWPADDDEEELVYTKDPDHSMFEVAPETSNNGAVIEWKDIVESTICPDGYRMPDQSEAQLMWVMMDAYPDNTLPQSIWSNTLHDIFGVSTYWFVRPVQEGYADVGNSGSKNHVRCIK